MPPSSKRICIGRIHDAHGVRGLVKILPYGEDPSLFETTCVYDAPSGGAPLSITLQNPQGKYILAKIEGVDDRDSALALRRTEIWLDREALPETEDDEFYIEDLKGLRVKTVSDTDGGHVIAVHDFGATPLLEIRPPEGSSYYLPFTKECVPDVHPGDGYLVINPPDGLQE